MKPKKLIKLMILERHHEAQHEHSFNECMAVAKKFKLKKLETSLIKMNKNFEDKGNYKMPEIENVKVLFEDLIKETFIKQ